MSNHQPTHTRMLKRIFEIKHVLAAGLVLSLTALPSISRADATWVGDTSQDWNNAANWSSDPANPTGNFFINNATAGVFPTLNAASAFAPVDIIIGSGTGIAGRLDQTAGTLATGGGNWLILGQNGGTGTFNLTGGTFSAGAIHMVRSGSGSTTGTLNIGGTANIAGATVVSDSQNINTTGNGVLNVLNGGTLNTENDLLIAFAGDANSSGTVNVAAGGTVNVATATVRWLIVSQWDTLKGILNVNGGTVNLNANTALRFSTGNNSGANEVNLNSGAITLWSGNQANPTTPNGEVDLNWGSGGANNTFNLNGGTLTTHRVMTANDNGTAAFNFNGGTLKANSSATDFVQLGGAGQTANVMNGGAIIDSAGFDVAIPQQLLAGGTGGLTKIGAGKLTLSGGYTYTGPTIVRGGTLALDAAQTSSSTSALSVSNATLTVSLNNGGSSLYAGGISLAGTNVLNFNFGTASSPSARAIDATGFSVSNTGTNTINITGPLLVVGQYPLIYTGSSVPTNNFKLGPLPVGMAARLVNSGTSLDLQVTAAGQSLTWYGADGLGNSLTNWNINSSSNWNTGLAKYLQYSGNSYGDNVTFDDAVYPGNTSINLGVRVVPSTVTFSSSSQAYSITGTGGIDGVVAVVVTNTGSVFMGTSNNYTGGTFIGGGTLSITNDSALGTNTSSVALMGGTLQFDASAANSRAFTVTADSGMGVASGATVQFSGSITGNAFLTKTGDGILNLTTPNAVSVLARVSAGAIKLSDANAATNSNIGPNVDNGVTFNSGIGTFNVAGLNGGAAWALSDTAAAPVKLVVGGNNSSSTFNGALTGAGSLVKVGTGTLTLNGAGTFTGGTFVSAGILASGNAVSPGLVTPFGTGNITVTNGGLLYLGTTVANAFASYQIPNNVSVDNGSVYAWDASQRIQGNLNIGAGGAAIGSTFNAPWEGFSEVDFPKALFIDGLVTGTGNLTVQDKGEQVGNAWNTSCAVFTSPGTAAQNTYSGTVTVNPLVISGSGGSYLYLVGTNVMANATINLTGNNLAGSSRMGTSTLVFGAGNVDGPGYMTIGGLSGSGSFVLANTILFTGGAGYSNGAPVALTVGKNNSSTTYSGVMSGAGSLIKVGSGTLTLSGANTYTGNTTVNAGTLELAQPTLAMGSTVSVSSGAALRLNFATTNRVTALVLNGVNKPVGVYNSTTGAPFITGTGSLLVQPMATNPTNITVSVSGNTLSLSWPADHLGWILQQQSNSLAIGLSTNWTDVAGSANITSTNITINPANPTVFYRLSKP